MSLDVSLSNTGKLVCGHCGSEYVGTEEVFDYNITHNLGKMAREVLCGIASLYEYLWRPDEINIKKAEELILPLTEGLKELKSNPDKYKEFNPKNGWGDYDGLVGFVEKYLIVCKEFPYSEIYISR